MGVDQSWEKLLAYLGELQTGNQEYYRVVHARLPECVKEFVLYDDKPRLDSGGFVHYTSWERFLNILDDDKREEPLFRMYNYEFANDPEEGNTKPLEWKQCEDKARELSQNFDPHWNGERSRKRSIYGCSFSTNGDGVEDNLMFWRLYGGDGNGCSFKLGGVPKRIYKVRYIVSGTKPPLSGIRARTHTSSSSHREFIPSSEHRKCDPIRPYSVRVVSNFQGQDTLPPFAILHSPVFGLIAALWPPHAARFNLSFLNRSRSARCNSSPIRCTFAATIDSPTVRSKPSLLRDLTRSNPCFSKFRIPASTAACARLAATNSSSLSSSFAAFDNFPFRGIATNSSSLSYAFRAPLL